MKINMLKILTCIVATAAALTVSCGGGQKPAAGTGDDVLLTDSVLMHGLTDTVRFGRLGEGEIAVRRLTMRNESSRPVVFVGEDVSCGCVSLEYDRRPVMPGGTVVVAVTFDSRGEYGWQMKRVLLRPGDAAPLKLYVEAEVE